MRAVRRVFRAARRTATRHARWTVLVMAALGLRLAGLLDSMAFDTVARFPVTANFVAGLLGAPAVLALAMLFLDRFAAADRRRGWALRNQKELHEDVPTALDALAAAIEASWPIAEAWGPSTKRINVAIPESRGVPPCGPVGRVR